MPLVNGFYVPAFYERTLNARNRAYRAWRTNPTRETWAAYQRAYAVYKKRYGKR